MKITLKILKLIAILIFIISAFLFSASFLLQDKVAGIILKSLNKNISTKLDFGSFRLSFLRKFPNASLELKNVLIHSAANFNSAGFSGINTDTLLSAGYVSVEFSITDIIKGTYIIKRVAASDGTMNLFTDTAGLVNYAFSVNTNSSSDFTIDIKRINLTDIKTCYNNLSSKLLINGNIKSGIIKSKISADSISFGAMAEMQITQFQYSDIRIIHPLNAELDLAFLSSEQAGLFFREGGLTIDGSEFRLKGAISSSNIYDLNISGKNIDIANISNYMPEKYHKLFSDYNPSGKIYINSSIKGLLSATSNPHVEVSCSFDKGIVTSMKSELGVKDLSFKLSFSNGSGNSSETSFVSIKDFEAKLGSASFAGSFSLMGPDHPSFDLCLKGTLIPAEVKDFFAIPGLSTAEGSVDFDLKYTGKPWPEGKIGLPVLLSLKPEAEMVFKSLGIGLKDKPVLFERINGRLSVSDFIQASDFSFNFKGQTIKIDGEFRNFPEWLTGGPEKLTVSASVFCTKLIPTLFLADNSSQGTTTRNNRAINLPDDIILDLNFKTDSLIYKSFSASGISGTLNYQPRLLIFKLLNMKSLNGTVSGNGSIIQNKNKSFALGGSFIVKQVDVKNTFTSFRNFGQNYLKAENLEGSLSGSLSLLLPLDSMLNPQIRSLTAEGHYIITNGALVNFDPVKQLSSFIELSELENISFNQLENDFFIRNNVLNIPQMDVKSSAADLSINGRHSFDNHYEYHVRMLLSEILSKKRKKNNQNASEFGIIKDDGLGRTSILLKIEKKEDEVKVGYDVKAAGNEIKSKIKSEKQTLKTILNEEYGWYKTDTVAKKRQAAVKSRFRITWDETDSLKR